MARTPIYLIPAPIGSYLSDMAVSSLGRLGRLRHVFIESEGRLIGDLRARGTLTDRHRLHVIDGGSADLAERLVEEGEPFALLADSGTPCFVDPGHRILRRLLDRHLEAIRLVPLGMSSALDAALACCGLDIQRFAFAGHHPENVDYTLAEGHRHPVVLYLGGTRARTWTRAPERHLPGWRRITLFANLRDRSHQRIARWERGSPAPEWVEDDSEDDYVAVIERRL